MVFSLPPAKKPIDRAVRRPEHAAGARARRALERLRLQRVQPADDDGIAGDRAR